MAGFTVIALTFGMVGGWAAVASLDSAVIATGSVAVENNRKSVQHLEGGIVRAISVKEGDYVDQNQLIIQLDDTSARTSVAIISSQLATVQVQEARLVAERDGLEAFVLPDELHSRSKEPLIQQTLNDQQHHFQERRRSIVGQTSVLEARIGQLKTEITGLTIEKVNFEKQIEFMNQELIGLRGLFEKNLVPVTKLYAMERDKIRMEGSVGRAIADTAKAEGAIGEVQLQIQQLRQKFQEDVATSLVETRARISDLSGRLAVAADMLNRIDIRAPRAGTVQSLKVFTVGQVIRPGEALLEIVPSDEPLIVQAQISPQDINVVQPGLVAEIRFPSFHARNLPILFGKIERVSRDRLIDETTRQPYFLALISVDRTQLPIALSQRMSAGQPAELVIATGERTVLQYLVQPLWNSMTKVGREQ